MGEDVKKNIFKEFWQLFLKPWHSGSFVAYFVMVIIFTSGCGVILSFVQSRFTVDSSVVSNLFTYSVALLLPIVIRIIQMILRFDKKVSMILTMVMVAIIEILLMIWIGLNNDAILPAIISTIVAWFFWVVVNSDNDYLFDEDFDKILKNDLTKHGQSWNNFNRLLTS